MGDEISYLSVCLDLSEMTPLASYPLFLPAMFSFYPNPTTSPSRIINKLPGNLFTVEEKNRGTAAIMKSIVLKECMGFS